MSLPASRRVRSAFLNEMPNGLSVDETLYALAEPEMTQLKVAADLAGLL